MTRGSVARLENERIRAFFKGCPEIVNELLRQVFYQFWLPKKVKARTQTELLKQSIAAEQSDPVHVLLVFSYNVSYKFQILLGPIHSAPQSVIDTHVSLETQFAKRFFGTTETSPRAISWALGQTDNWRSVRSELVNLRGQVHDAGDPSAANQQQGYLN